VNRLRPFAVLCAMLGFAGVALGADGYGKLSGVVSDPAGNPQMGATILLSAEAVGGRAPLQLLTNQNGIFTGQHLRPGLYSVKATLAGFLPTMEQHISVGADATTLIHIELDSVFASLDTLRRPASQPAENDDWRWVLRTSAASRPVLQFSDGSVIVADSGSSNADAHGPQPHAQVEMTSGASEPGSSSARSGAIATTASYDQSLGRAGRLLMAGRLQYPQSSDGSLGGSAATIWVPSGDLNRGPETTVVIRQVQISPQDGVNALRTMRVEHTERMSLTNHIAVEYGAEYAMGGVVGTMTSAVRPHARVGMQLSPAWSAVFSLETNPDAQGLWAHGSDLGSAIGALDTLPVLVWQNGHAALAGGWHEEVAVRRKLSARASVEGAAFHDYSSHAAVFGFDPNSPSPVGLVSGPWAHDAGADGSWGTRVVYRERIFSDLELSAIYTWAGALAPNGDPISSGANLSQSLSTRYRNSAAARVSGRIPKAKTEVTASYKWLDGTVVSRQDLFGEAALGLDPNLSLTVRQPLPSFRAVGHWEVIADFRNILAQGYVPINEQDGQLMLMPVERSFRGGVSFQF
jgi:hypothetical protein